MILLAFAIAGIPYGALLVARPQTMESLAPWAVRVMGAVILVISGLVALA